MGGSNNLAANGARLSAISQQASRVPDGATVYITGGHNDVPAGTRPDRIASQLKRIIANLELVKGCTVNYILFPIGTKNTNQENMEPTREAIKNAGITIFHDLEGSPMQADGIHAALSAYRGIIRQQGASNRQPAAAPTTASSRNTTPSSQSDEYITSGPPYPPEHYGVVRALQYALDTLGYSVGETGYDGKFGPRTTRALRSFKRDYNVPGPASAFGLPTIRKFEQIAAGQVARVETPTPTGNQPTARYGSGGRATTSDDPNFQAPGYPTSMTRSRIEDIIAVEAEQRGIDPGVAIRIFRHEGAGSYQSSVPRRGRGSLGGREASFGPYQLYIGGGLGNEYQRQTGRDLTTDNTEEGITNQIRFALDMAVRDSWQPWYGRGPAGVGRRQGLEGAREVGNWS
jgi:peptidoglycan hydrolase-like protein with peptidoglycan-binding domain